MFIELAEFLRCPSPHQDAHLVVAPDRMEGRSVISGTVGCPVCKREYGIIDGKVQFGLSDLETRNAALTVDGGGLRALLDLGSPGGYVVLVGSASWLSTALAEAIHDVHHIAVNPPADQRESNVCSIVQNGTGLPIRTSVARGVVLGSEFAIDPWRDEAVRVLLRGRRLVVLDEIQCPPAVRQLAVGSGMFVGERM